MVNDWKSIHTEYWKFDYPQEGENIICDGTQWSLFVRYDVARGVIYSGDNTYPENWDALLALFDIVYDDEDEEKLERKPGQFIYCSVSFSKDGDTFYYQTESEEIKIGDWVIVPFGSENAERVAVVEEIEFFEQDKVPFPLCKTKHILRRRT